MEMQKSGSPSHAPSRSASGAARFLRWVGITLITVAAWGIWQVWGLLYGRPTIDTDYRAEITKLIGEYQPEGEDAWPEFSRGVELFSHVSRQLHDEAKAEEDRLRADNNDPADEAQDLASFVSDDFESLSDEEQQQLIREFYQRVDDAAYAHLYRDYSRVNNDPEYVPDLCKVELEEINRLKEAGVFVLMHAAALKPRMVAPILHAKDESFGGDLIMDSAIPVSLSMILDLSQAMTARMRIALAESDSAVHQQMLYDALAMAKLTAAQGGYIYPMTAAGAASYPLRELRYELSEHLIPAEAIPDLATTLNDQAGWLDPFNYEVPLQTEHAMALDTVQNWYTRNLLGNGHLIVTKLPEFDSWGNMTVSTTPSEPTFVLRLINLTAYSYPSRREVEHALEQWYDLHRALIPQTVGNRDVLHDQTDALYKKLPANGETILGSMTPRLARLCDGLDLAALSLRSTRLMMALEMYRYQHGTYPTSLDDLVPDFLSEFPTDSTNGMPIGYIVRTEDAGYLLYSWGMDRLDNHGTHCAACLDSGEFPDDKHTAWSMTTIKQPDLHTGCDFVINSPRPMYEP